MHFEILVEDRSGKTMLDHLIPKIIGERHTYRVMAYKGIGRLPKGMQSVSDADRRILLDQLPRILQGYGETYPASSDDYPVCVVVICDLDDRCLKAFRRELDNLLNRCNPKPHARFCLAVEEGEAWLLGDLNAVRQAYPKARKKVLSEYVNDSICGTWERLADAVYPGGAKELEKGGYQIVGREKSVWAQKIGPYIDIESNESNSFRYFRDTLKALAGNV